MPTTSPSRTDLESLLEINHDYIRSVQTSDVRRFDEILADDFLCSNPDGSLVDREGFLKQTAQPVKISGLAAHYVNVRLLGATPGSMVGRLRPRHPLLTAFFSPR